MVVAVAAAAFLVVAVAASAVVNEEAVAAVLVKFVNAASVVLRVLVERKENLKTPRVRKDAPTMAKMEVVEAASAEAVPIADDFSDVRAARREVVTTNMRRRKAKTDSRGKSVLLQSGVFSNAKFE